MNKREFLQQLRELLEYELPERMVSSNIEFYSEYIDTAVAEGRPQTEVLADLGDPRLIAKTIVDAAKSGPDGIPNTEDDNDFSGEIFKNGRDPEDRYSGGAESGNSGYRGSGTRGGFGDTGEGRTFDPFSGNVNVYGHSFGCGTGIVLMLVFFLVLSMIGALLGALSPILAPVLLVMLLMWLFRQIGGGG